MVYIHQKIQEFDKQIKEHLDKGLVKNSKSPHINPAFVVRNHTEEKRETARIVINYKMFNLIIILSLMVLIFQTK